MIVVQHVLISVYSTIFAIPDRGRPIFIRGENRTGAAVGHYRIVRLSGFLFRNKRYLSYALINLAMVAATLAFGLLTEMRVWVDLSLPVVLAMAVALASADAHSAHNRSAG